MPLENPKRTGRILDWRRRNASRNGNPTFEVQWLDDDADEPVWLRTMTDASCAYEVTNFRPSDRLTIELTRAGRVRTITLTPESERA
jgi:hypothetical protein